MARAVFLAAAIATLAACGGTTPDREVRLLAPAGYVEDGSTDPAADWVTSFERHTGCTVDLRVVDDGEDLVALARRRNADELGTIELARIASYRALHPTLRRLTPGGVPHAWGRLVIVGRSELSWDDVLRAAAVTGVYDSPLLLEVFREDAVRSFFARGGTLWTDDVTAALSLRRRETLRGIGPEQIAALAPGAQATIPPDGTVGWVTAWVIRRGGDNPDCAHRWIAQATSARVNRRAARFAGVRPAHCDTACPPIGRVRFPVVSPTQRERWRELVENVATRR